jgi:hypothetical protein
MTTPRFPNPLGELNPPERSWRPWWSPCDNSGRDSPPIHSAAPVTGYVPVSFPDGVGRCPFLQGTLPGTLECRFSKNFRAGIVARQQQVVNRSTASSAAIAGHVGAEREDEHGDNVAYVARCRTMWRRPASTRHRSLRGTSIACHRRSGSPARYDHRRSVCDRCSGTGIRTSSGAGVPC